MSKKVHHKKQKQNLKQLQEEDLIFLIQNTQHHSWITRFNAFEKLTETIQEISSEKIKISEELFDELIQCHIDHMNDLHFKVSLNCLTSLTKLFSLF